MKNEQDFSGTEILRKGDFSDLHFFLFISLWNSLTSELKKKNKKMSVNYKLGILNLSIYICIA